MTSNASELFRALIQALPPQPVLPVPLNAVEMGMFHGSVNVLVIIRMVPFRLPECSRFRNFSRLIEIEKSSFLRLDC